MRVQVLHEGSRPHEIGYHFTYIDNLFQIAKSNFMQATNEPIQPSKNPTGNYIYEISKNTYIKVPSKDYNLLKKFFSGEDVSLNKLTDLRLKTLILKSRNAKSEIFDQLIPVQKVIFPELVGKNSWSLTRKPEGFAYRNMRSDSGTCVRIAVDVDKLSATHRIIPFSWLEYSKNNDSRFEFEERVFKKGKGQFLGTKDFASYITEIAFDFRLVETLKKSFSYTIFFRVNRLKKLIKSAKLILSNKDSLTEKNISEIKEMIIDLKEAASAIPDDLVPVNKDSVFKLNETDEMRTYLNNKEKAIAILTKLNPDIKIIYINPYTCKKDSLSYSESDIKDYLKSAETYGKTYFTLPVQALNSPLFDSFIKRVNKMLPDVPDMIEEARLVQNELNSILNNDFGYRSPASRMVDRLIKELALDNKFVSIVSDGDKSFGLAIHENPDPTEILSKLDIRLFNFNDDLLLTPKFILDLLGFFDLDIVTISGRSFSKTLRDNPDILNSLNRKGILIYSTDRSFHLTYDPFESGDRQFKLIQI